MWVALELVSRSQQNDGLFVAEVLDEELTEGAFDEADLLFIDAGGLVLAGGDVQSDATPGGRSQRGEFFEKLWRAPPKGNEVDALCIEAFEPIVGGQLGVEDQVARSR